MFNAAALHATSKEEYADIRRLGITAPVAVISNGIDLPDLDLKMSEAGHPRRLLFLGRIHPTKGVDILLESWKTITVLFPEWELVIAGPVATPYAQRMRQQACEMGLTKVRFAGEVTGRDKTLLYRSADLFVLPSHSENFGIAVAEALAHGLPSIVTRGAPWSGLELERCGWWIEQGVGPLSSALREAMSRNPDELASAGARGRDWMRREFSWDHIGEMMAGLYAWLLGRGPRPGCVVID